MRESQMLLIPKAGDRPVGADIDPTGTYRYDLRRSWGDDGFKVVNFIMLNPSTADASEDDPTIRRCIGFAKSWGYGGLVVTNLFALRSTDPKRIYHHADPIGPLNNFYIARWAGGADLVVAAWGAHGCINGRAAEVLHRLRGSGIVPHYLKLTMIGQPRHPLYLQSGLVPIPMEGAAI
jgi:hypothetical protein